MANQLRKRYDIIINGGGIVGFTLLNLLQKSPHLRRCKVLLIEQASEPTTIQQPKRSLESHPNSVSELSTTNETEIPIFSNRVSSITLKSRLILERLGIWPEIDQYAKSVRCIKVWNYNYADRMTFKVTEGNSCNMFSVLENNRLSLGLINSIYQTNESAIRWNSSLRHMEKSPTGKLIDVVVEDGTSKEESVVCAPLVLGCDGFGSKVREFARMKYHEFSLEKSAVVGTVKIETDFMNPSKQINDIAYQRFSVQRDTVAALLPLDEKHSSFVISAPTDYAKHLLEMGDDEFIFEFNRLLSDNESPNNFVIEKIHEISNLAINFKDHFMNSKSSNNSETDFSFGSEVEAPKVMSVVEKSRAMFPLVFGTTTPKMIASLNNTSYEPQIALLGDSSHRIHPLAGQGLNLGISDAYELSLQLEEICKCGERVFNENDTSLLAKALKRYEIKRQAYVAPMSLGILVMPYLFRIAPPSMVSTFDKLNLLKKPLVKFANGM